MYRILFLLVFSFFSLNANSQNIKQGSKIEVNDTLIYEIIPRNAQVEILAEGFNWIEGPVWIKDEKKLLFSDIPENCIYEWTEKNGVKLFLQPSGYTGQQNKSGEIGSNGLTLNPAGDLVLCQHGDRKVAQLKTDLKQPKPVFSALADNYHGKKLNSPNDAVFDKKGNLYFTDPPYGLEFNMDDPSKELDFQGVYKTDLTGKTQLLTKKLSRPNGLAFSPDETLLYVANSDSIRAIWMEYKINQDGNFERERLFYDITDKTASLIGLPDGLKVHKNGWIFATGPGGLLIFTPQGEHLGTIVTGEKTSNCAFNTDYSELFITADDFLLRIKLKTN